MRKCVQCGNIVENQVEICPKCGCYVSNLRTLTLERASQFFLINPAVEVVIKGHGGKKILKVENGQTVQFKLPADQYHLFFSFGFSTAELDIDLSKNMAIYISSNRFSGKLEVWEK